jgi:HAD superfamily hydrolase (TIGR01484 family)
MTGGDSLSRARRLAELSAADARDVRAIATDFDGTMTTDGKMPAVAYAALWDAHDAGVPVIIVTGRSAGFADHVARAWPVAGAVAETGAMACGLRTGRMVRYDVHDLDARAANRAQLDAIGRDLLAELAAAGTPLSLASDQSYREYDLALDFSEDVETRLAPDAIEAIVAKLVARGCRAQYSSAHINAWLGDYDKAGMLLRFLREHLGIAAAPGEPDAARVVYVGDALNDQPLFRVFPLSVGVANLADVADRLTDAPAYLTRARGGEGFAELVRAVLEARSG